MSLEIRRIKEDRRMEVQKSSIRDTYFPPRLRRIGIEMREMQMGSTSPKYNSILVSTYQPATT